jgi:hypothetical protein
LSKNAEHRSDTDLSPSTRPITLPFGATEAN